MTTTIIHDNTVTGEQPVIEPANLREALAAGRAKLDAERPRGGWISDGSQPPGRHREGRSNGLPVADFGVDPKRRAMRRVQPGEPLPVAQLLARIAGATT